jgi:hypothetical protein
MLKKLILFALMLCLGVIYAEESSIQEQFDTIAKTQDAAIFTPPSGWKLADPKALPEYIKVMVVGSGKNEFPPSMNLAFDPFSGSLQEYMKIVKAINDSQKAIWKDLGPFQVGKHDGRLIQVDSRTKWGEERQLQLIVVFDGAAYILTASALKEEFPQFYPEFFKAMKSFTISIKEKNQEKELN